MNSMLRLLLLLVAFANFVSGNRTLISNVIPNLSIESDELTPTVTTPLIVSTRNGLIRGTSLRTSDRRKTVSAFLGVPFARPPG